MTGFFYFSAAIRFCPAEADGWKHFSFIPSKGGPAASL
jgi:hypothetical protein